MCPIGGTRGGGGVAAMTGSPLVVKGTITNEASENGGLLSMAETFRYATVGAQGAVLNHAVPAHTRLRYSASLKSLSPPRGS